MGQEDDGRERPAGRYSQVTTTPVLYVLQRPAYSCLTLQVTGMAMIIIMVIYKVSLLLFVHEYLLIVIVFFVLIPFVDSRMTKAFNIDI